MAATAAAGVGRDSAGGVIGPGPVVTVFNQGVLCVTVGNVVLPSASGTVVVGPGSLTVSAQGLPLCRVGLDGASNGVPIVGASTVFAS